nr:GNAT family N-acetyltransferase [Seonamhaeicola sp. ML3]
MEIKTITTEDVLDIRHKVMWPNMPKDYVKIIDDNLAKHFGVFENNKLVSIVSLFIKNDEVQFRKFATLEEYQDKGYGSRLLNHIIDYSQKKGYKKIWCNARVNKTNLYHKFGLKETNQTYVKGGIEFVIMEKEL